MKAINKFYKSYVRNQWGLSLTEMIGVLAILAILAALLLPRIFEAVKESQAEAAVMSIRSVEAAVTKYYTRYGFFGDENGHPYTTSKRNWDAVLVKLGLLRNPLSLSVGAAIDLQVAKCNIKSADGVVDCTQVSPSKIEPGYIKVTGDPDYDLDGDGDSDTAHASFVVQVVIADVSREVAKMINDMIDGEALGVPIGQKDIKGRVKYNAAPRKRVTDVWIYIAHD